MVFIFVVEGSDQSHDHDVGFIEDISSYARSRMKGFKPNFESESTLMTPHTDLFFTEKKKILTETTKNSGKCPRPTFYISYINVSKHI